MKRTILFINCITGIICTVYAQGVTSFGDGASVAGQYNSNFGKSAGTGLSTSKYNTGIGIEAGRGDSYNTAVGAYALWLRGLRSVAIGAGTLFYSSLSTDGDGSEENVAVGSGTMYSNVYGGSYNTAVGHESLDGLNAGFYNSALGHQALRYYGPGIAGTEDGYNTAVGTSALYSNAGIQNTASGYQALYENLDGNYNTASGSYSLHENNTGERNTASGYSSLYSNTTGNQNTAIGNRALYGNSLGYYNTAIGSQALNANINGNFNTATGYYAGHDNNVGTHNTANGFRALENNTTGSYNTAQGAFALYESIGGNYNSALGYSAGPTLDLLNNTTAIGYLARPTASNQVRVGNVSVTSIGGQVAWTAFSDGRFKKEIREDISGLDFITALRPVSYIVDNESLNTFLHVNDSSGNQAEAKSVPARQTGFVAQEVEALVKKSGYVFSGVDAPENENDPYGIRYAEFVVPLVKAVQEFSAKVENRQQQIDLLLAELDSTRKGNETDNSRAVLLQNSPHPFDSETEIKMTLADDIKTAAVMIYNTEGKQEKKLHVTGRGDVSVKISANELSAGMYLYSLITDGKVVDTKRMVITQ